MSLTRFHKSPFAKMTVVVALASLLATLLPPRTARADAAAGLTPVAGAAGIGPGPSQSPPSEPTTEPGTVDTSTGAAQTSYTFQLPAARGDTQPSLRLSYNSRNGVGPAGVGWTLNVPSITRRGRAGIPRFSDAVLGDPSQLASDPNSDDYYIDGRLLLLVDATTYGTFDDPPANRVVLFRAEVDDGCRYFLFGTGKTWLMQTKSGHVLEFGIPVDGGAGSVERADPVTANTLPALNNAPPNPIYRWNLVREWDATGNITLYQWDDESQLFATKPSGPGIQYLTDIFDTSLIVPTTDKTVPVPDTSTFAHHAHLTWTLAQYPETVPVAEFPPPYTYSPIWKALPYAQLSSVDVTSTTSSSVTPRQLVRRYELGYSYNPTQTRSYLTSIQEIGDCESQGGSIPETSAGIVGTDSATKAKLSTCAAIENMPRTNYAYTGITNIGALPPDTFPTPQIISKTPAYTAPLAADFLADLDGDAADELIAGTNGYALSQCLTCSMTLGEGLLTGFTWGLYAAGGGQVEGSCSGTTQTCFGPGGIQGPDETDGTTFSMSHANGLNTASINDSMFSFAVAADWAPTGRKSFLQLWPPSLIHGVGQPWFTNNNITMLTLSQFGGNLATSSQATYQSLFTTHNISTADATNIQYLNGANGSGGPPTGISPGLLMADRAIDVDGDGLPDMGLIPLGTTTITGYATFFSSRDRVGATHPFLQRGTDYCPSPAYDPASYAFANGTTSQRLLTDIDGDGLPDLVFANKFAHNLNTSGPLNYENFFVLPNRGDGRFGVPATPGTGTPPCYQSYNRALTPIDASLVSASDPVGPDTTQSSVVRFGDLNGDGLSDFAVLDSQGLHICLRNGGAWEYAAYRCVNDPTLPGNDQSNAGLPHPTILIGDTDGSGINQVVYFPAPLTPFGAPAGNATAVRVSPSGPPDGLLQTVTTSAGATTTFSYQSVHQLNSQRGIGSLPVPLWVVTGTTTANNFPSTGTANNAVTIAKQYFYQGPVYDSRERQFVGFKSVQQVTLADASNNAQGQSITTTFATDACIPPSGSVVTAGYGCSVPETDYSLYHAIRGLPNTVSTNNVQANESVQTHLTTTLNYYQFQRPYTGLDGRSGISLQSINAQTSLWDEINQTATATSFSGITGPNSTFPTPTGTFANVSLPKTSGLLRQVTNFDVNGNRTSVTNYGFNGQVNGVNVVDPVTSHTWKWALPTGDTSGWNWRVMKEVVSYVTGPGTSRETDYNYDSLGRLIQTSRVLSGTVTLPGVGGVARVALPPGQSSDGSITYNYQLDSYGNVYNVTSSKSNCLLGLGYDTAYKQLVVSRTISPNADCTTGLLTTSYAYDRGLEVITSTMDEQQRVTAAKYDDFGRLVELDKPSLGGAMGTIAVLYVDTYGDLFAPVRTVHYRTGFGAESTNGGTAAPSYVDHYVYLDSFGDVRARVDAVDTATHPGYSWILSGIHSSYTNGRVNNAYRPMFLTGAGPALGVPPAQVLSPIGPAAVFYYDGLGRVTAGLDYNKKPFKNVYHLASLSTDVYDQEQTSGSHKAFKTVVTDGYGRVVEVDTNLSAGPDGTAGIAKTKTTYQVTGEPLTVQEVLPSGASATHSITYDSLGRMVQNTEPNVGTWTYAYDDMDQLVGTADARGCGENIGRDLLEREVFADYIPCASAVGATAQSTHTPPAPNGDGTEEFYVYDDIGRLTDAYDLARHDGYSYWGNGLVAQIGSVIATPTGGSSLGTRYGNPPSNGTAFEKVFTTYSVTGDVMEAQTGNLPSTFPSFASFTESMTYTQDGHPATTAAAFADWSGNVLSASQYRADGNVASRIFGDVATTNTVNLYDDNGELTFYHLTRNAGQYANGAFVNTVTPAAPDNTTTQADLMTLVIGRDTVGNPQTVSDISLGTWQNGYKQVSQTYTYSDDYRLRTVVTNNLPDGWVSPDQADPSGTYPVVNTPLTMTRLRSQAFQYDWRGNMTSSIDDALDFPDRSLGLTVQASGSSGPDEFGQVNLANGRSAAASYDAAGHLYWFNPKWNNASTSEGYSYQWNELGQLGQAQRTDSDGLVHVQETYVYDRNGQRVITARSNPSAGSTGQTLYTVNVYDTLVLEGAQYLGAQGYQDDETTANFYLSGGLLHVVSRPNLPVSSTTNAGTTGVHWFLNLPDSRGSTAFVVDYQTGEVVERSAYQAYGMIDTDFRPNPRWGAFREDVKFGGHWDNAEVGLTYMGARYYSPQLGRFVSPDPLTIHGLQGINPYEYASSSPIRYVDSTGLDGEDASWDQLSLEDQAAYQAAMTAYENGDWTTTDPNETVPNASDAPSATPEELPSQSITGPSDCTGECASFTAAAATVSAAAFSGGLSLGGEAIAGLGAEALPFLAVNAARVTTLLNTMTLAEQGIAVGASAGAYSAATNAAESSAAETVDLFHGTVQGSVSSIQAGLRPVSVNTAPFPAGSFFTTMGPDAQVAASHWAARSAQLFRDGPVVLRGTLPKSLFDSLSARGLIHTGPVPGLPFFPPQTVILPAGLPDVSSQIQWIVVPLKF